jgi:hypothetical protein
MLSEMQRRKITRMFRLFDQDSDGQMVWGDYARVSTRLVDAIELPRTTPEGAELLDSYRVEWDEIAGGPDGTVALDRWLAYRGEQLSVRDAFEVNIAPYILTIATNLDRDRDGVLVRDDLWRYLGLYQMPDADRDLALARLAPPGARPITYVGLEDLVREFYYSNNPEAPGSWFLGPF